MRMNQKLPKVSFVIPTLNSEKMIGRCLESILKQDYPELEIVIVDGGSRDLTVKIASKYTSKIFFDPGTLGSACQTGVNKSKGEIIGLFDSDIILPPSPWLRLAVGQFKKNNNIGIVWPINKAPQNASIIARCYFNFWNKRLGKSRSWLPGFNSLILRKAFDDVNGFNIQIDFGQDMDLMRRIVRKGYKVAIFNRPIIHDSMRTLKEFIRKQLRGASSLFNIKQDETRDHLLHACMTWEFRENTISSRHLIKEAFFSHILTGLNGMIEGLIKNRDRSWVILPLLLYIRTEVYGVFFLRNRIRCIFS